MIRRLIFGSVGLAAFGVTVTLVALATQTVTTQLLLVDRAGRQTVLGTVPNDAFAPRLSPDGSRLVFNRSGGTLWTVDIPAVGEPKRLPALPDAQFVAWDGTGERVFYIAAPDRNQALFFTRADGSGFPRVAMRDPARAPDSYSPVHRGLSFITLDGDDYDIWFYSEADRKTIPLVVVRGSRQLSSQISPDGNWVAYKSDETGEFEVWVQPFPTGERIRLTTRGGSNPLWSNDGTELYFDDGNRLFAASVTSRTPLRFSVPTPLPVTGFVQSGSLRRHWNLMPDGRFLVMVR